MNLTVNFAGQKYSVFVESGILSRAEKYISDVYTGRKIMIISDDLVFPLYGRELIQSLPSYECFSLVLPHGESTKSFHSLPLIYSALLENNITRSDLIIALGGGVIGDLVGFAASSYLRGINYIQIPTSLLAQVDSSIGGKVAVDLPQGKNLVGAFYSPILVLVDPDVLSTLPERFITDGMGEVIKYGCIRDKKLFSLLADCGSFEKLKPHLEETIFRCIDIKRSIVENDPYDKGERMLLNFGHTLAHSVEQYFHYKRESHGEAVAIGMYQITRLSEALSLTSRGTLKQLEQILQSYNLPISCGLPMSSLMSAMKLDKKHINNKLNIVLLKEIGDSFILPTTINFFNMSGDI